MGKILVAYDSGYGATAAAANFIADALSEKGRQVDLRPAGAVDLSLYDAIILGSPIRLGRCTPLIKRFLKKNREALASKRAAFLLNSMVLNSQGYDAGSPLYIDPLFAEPPKAPARLGFMANNHTASYYLDRFIKLAPGIKPAGIAIFKGRLHMAELKALHRLIMRFAKFALPEIEDGDFLNAETVRAWAQGLAI
jgi:menaquinone-dependent protoporphyrinogen IX oxidase